MVKCTGHVIVDRKVASSKRQQGFQQGTAGGRSGFKKGLVYGKTTYQSLSAAAKYITRITDKNNENTLTQTNEIVEKMLNPAVEALHPVIKKHTEELLDAMEQCAKEPQPYPLKQISYIFLLSVNLYCLKQTYYDMTLNEIPEQKTLKDISFSVLEVYSPSLKETSVNEAARILNTLKDHLQSDSEHFIKMAEEQKNTEKMLGNFINSNFETNSPNITASKDPEMDESRNELFQFIKHILLSEYLPKEEKTRTLYGFDKLETRQKAAKTKGDSHKDRVNGFNARFENQKQSLNETIEQQLKLWQQPQNSETANCEITIHEFADKLISLYEEATGSTCCSLKDLQCQSWSQEVARTYFSITGRYPEANDNFIKALSTVVSCYLNYRKNETDFTRLCPNIAASYNKLPNDNRPDFIEFIKNSDVQSGKQYKKSSEFDDIRESIRVLHGKINAANQIVQDPQIWTDKVIKAYICISSGGVDLHGFIYWFKKAADSCNKLLKNNCTPQKSNLHDFIEFIKSSDVQSGTSYERLSKSDRLNKDFESLYEKAIRKLDRLSETKNEQTINTDVFNLWKEQVIKTYKERSDSDCIKMCNDVIDYYLSFSNEAPVDFICWLETAAYSYNKLSKNSRRSFVDFIKCPDIESKSLYDKLSKSERLIKALKTLYDEKIKKLDQNAGTKIEQENKDFRSWTKQVIKSYALIKGGDKKTKNTKHMQKHIDDCFQMCKDALDCYLKNSLNQDVSFMCWLRSSATYYVVTPEDTRPSFIEHIKHVEVCDVKPHRELYKKLYKKSNLVRDLLQPNQEPLPEFSKWYDLVSLSINEDGLQDSVSIEDLVNTYLKLPGDTSPSFMQWLDSCVIGYYLLLPANERTGFCQWHENLIKGYSDLPRQERPELLKWLNEHYKNPNSALMDVICSNVGIHAGRVLNI